jgi:peptidoglycan hydrolase CwlO-like protein
MPLGGRVKQNNNSSKELSCIASKLEWLVTQLEEVQVEYDELAELFLEIERDVEKSNDWYSRFIATDLELIGDRIRALSENVVALVRRFKGVSKTYLHKQVI